MPRAPEKTTTALAALGPATRAWFAARFPAATAVQAAAWAAIAAGGHTLVIAPTGSGKTLAAFLHAIDRLFTEREAAPAPEPGRRRSDSARGRTRILYISPIKALAADVHRNLQIPLEGIAAERQRQGATAVELTVATRSGDTPAAARARIQRRPPDILITTPESLFLMLTSNAREVLRGVDTVIVDEIHAVAGSKRGTHLALSLERLDALLPSPAQRIGLSATVRPADTVARFLGGQAAVTVVDPPSRRRLDVEVVVPVPDMTDIPPQEGEDAREAGGRSGSIWPHMEAAILDQVLRHRSTIVFVNARGVAERLTARINALFLQRHPEPGDAADAVAGTAAIALGSFTGSTANRVQGGTRCIARAHHGSVSREQRADIEQALKTGALRCVVATSSLELGIDMGEVDLVIQVGAPPSVASALQRIGRAGHQVDGISTGSIYPRTRRDLVDAAVAVEGMQLGRLEVLSPPRNPLDVLAQQTVAAVGMEDLHVDQWYATVRRAAPYAALPRSAFDAVLDMLAGRYPSDDFAGFRPRLVWDRPNGMLRARPGALRLAVTSGGTIPDRGMYNVMLPEGGEQAGSRRVGELDEEMVHESRVNDVITLGATSWRIDRITHDQVIVTPAPGRSARLPFWRGEGTGRAAGLGEGIGRFLARFEDDEAEPGGYLRQLRGLGLDEHAASNLLALVDEQRRATGVLPTDRRLVVECCRDEAGDWRVMLHSPYGRRVHDPWALAVAERLRQHWGIDPAVVSSDDGIVLRLPDSTARAPDADLFVFDAQALRQTVGEAVQGTALFAARFRECASRALLLPRQSPGKRAPLWQQRLRAGELLGIVRAHPGFPMVAEAARECLQDVYDLDALAAVLQRIESGDIVLVQVTTEVPSPFAASLLFGYVAEFLYGADVPQAERRSALLALDNSVLTDLLGEADLGEVLDDAVVQRIGAELQRLPPARHVRGREGVADLLRELGPLGAADVACRLLPDAVGAEGHLSALHDQGRIFPAVIAGQPRWAVVEDAARLRDALGVSLPDDMPTAFLAPVADPLAELLLRYARTHAPFDTRSAAVWLGLGVAPVAEVLQRLQDQGRLLAGRFRPSQDEPIPGAPPPPRQPGWVDPAVLQRLRLGSLQQARSAVRPVAQAAYARLLLERHGVAMGTAAGKAPRVAQGALQGAEGVLRVVEQLAGVPLPASVWESQVLPARVRDFTPALLDQVLATGDVVWMGHARLGDDDGWVSLHLHEPAAVTLPAVPALSPVDALTPMQGAILRALDGGGAFFARQLAERASSALQGDPPQTAESFQDALWHLAWRGEISSDLWAPLRALQTARTARPRTSAPRRRRGGFMIDMGPRPDEAAASGIDLPTASTSLLAGRWSRLVRPPASDTARVLALAEGLLDRHVVVTRSAAVTEQVAGGFPALQAVYRRLEDAARVLRGRFVDGLGGTQFAARGDIDRLRQLAGAAPAAQATVVALSMMDPANPYGSVLPWPTTAAGVRPARRAGALVVLADGVPVLHLAQGGRALLAYIDVDAAVHAPLLAAAAQALASALRRGRRQTFTLTQVNEQPIGRGALADALRAAGFSRAPTGLSWEG